MRELRVFTGKQTASVKKIWNAVPEKAKDQIRKMTTKSDSIIYECLPYADFLTFLGKDTPGQTDRSTTGKCMPINLQLHLAYIINISVSCYLPQV